MKLRTTTAILIPVVLLCALVVSVCLTQAQDQQGQSTQPPAGAQSQTTQPETPSTPPAQEPASQENSPPTAAPQSPSACAQKPKPIRRKKKAAPKPQSGQSGKVIVRNGGAREDQSQLSPGVSKEEELHQRETTAQLLATTDANLKRVAARQLTPTQQSAVDQINSYVRQAKAATDSGDVARAHTLAFKAHLLSDDLARK